ncbi:MAG: hypothetical protein VXX79_11870 [Pseudomonadota bacterium]|jgi:predicted transcriptional regulator|nr:hypothetical protein [Pseudomonadota bacterium]
MKSTLERFRTALDEETITLRQAEKATGIPYTTLIKMKAPDWQAQTFERIESVGAFLETELGPVPKEKDGEVA